MDAVILAAGRGERIRDFDPNIPKPLLKIKDKSLLNYLLENLESVVDRVIIVIGFMGEKIQDKIGNKFNDLPILYIKQEVIEGTGKAIFSIKDIVSDSFVVLNGDCYYSKEDIIKCINCKYALLVKEPNPMLNGGVIVKEDQTLKEVLEKEGRTDLCNTGLYKLDKKVFQYPLIKSKRGEYEITSLLNELSKNNRVEVIKTKVWAHISYTSDILTLTKFLDGYGTKKKSFSNIIFEEDNKVMLMLRSNEPWLPFRNHWQFIGGLIENDEKPIECAIRELKEELNLDLIDSDLEYIITLFSEMREDFIFKCTKKVDWSNTLLREGEEIKFVLKSELSTLKLVPADRKIVDQLYPQKNIPLAKPYIDENEIKAVIEVLNSGVLSLGPKLVQFEKDFANYMNSKYAIAVSSGTAGLHLGIKSLGIGENDEVITSPFSFISSANSILFENAKPVFVDIDEDTLNIDPKKIEAAITPRTKAILPVHIFGQSCNMDLIMKIAKKHNLKIMEDACESVGAKYKNKLVGTKGDLAVFAFYPNKQITTGEGGMIITDNEEIYKTCASLRNQGRDSMSWLGHNRLGYNYRLNELSCALGIEQLKKLPLILSRRQKVAERYNHNLKDFPGIRLPYIAPDNIPSWFVYVIRLDKDLNRNLVMEKLKGVGVSSKEYLPSIHLQPFYKEKYGFKEGDFPVSEKVSASTIALPFYTQISDEDVDYVCEKLKEVIKVMQNGS